MFIAMTLLTSFSYMLESHYFVPFWIGFCFENGRFYCRTGTPYRIFIYRVVGNLRLITSYYKKSHIVQAENN